MSTIINFIVTIMIKWRLALDRHTPGTNTMDDMGGEREREKERERERKVGASFCEWENLSTVTSVTHFSSFRSYCCSFVSTNTSGVSSKFP